MAHLSCVSLWAELGILFCWIIWIHFCLYLQDSPCRVLRSHLHRFILRHAALILVFALECMPGHLFQGHFQTAELQNWQWCHALWKSDDASWDQLNEVWTLQINMFQGNWLLHIVGNMLYPWQEHFEDMWCYKCWLRYANTVEATRGNCVDFLQTYWAIPNSSQSCMATYKAESANAYLVLVTILRMPLRLSVFTLPCRDV